MAIDEATAARIARLARLEIGEGELAPLAQELSAILTWIEQLNAVDIEGVEPMTSVVGMGLRWRTDEVTDGNCAGDILANAPETEDGFFVVPKVIE